MLCFWSGGAASQTPNGPGPVTTSGQVRTRATGQSLRGSRSWSPTTAQHHQAALAILTVTAPAADHPALASRMPERMVPLRYHCVMAMNLRLTDAESEALRTKAEEEGRSMQEVARAAIAQYVSERPQRLKAAIDRVRAEDSELLERLSR
jgi:predicted transcriptional regulator